MAESTSTKSLAIPLTAFAAGAVVALLVGVFGKVHDPTLAGTTTFGFNATGTPPSPAPTLSCTSP